MLKFATERSSDDWRGDELDDKLRLLVTDAVNYLSRTFSLDTVATCLLRTAEEDKALYHDPHHEPGVHVYGRGCDISVRNLSRGEIERLVNTLNDRWSYDSTRPTKMCALFETGEDTGSTADHIHLQVHPNTKVVAQEA